MTIPDNREPLPGSLDGLPMGRPQIWVICVSMLLAALDGYDMLATAFVAPALSLAWGMDKAALGILFSSGVLGMAIGSVVISPCADIFGRRPALFTGLLLMTVGSLCSGFCEHISTLAAFRLLTGMGVGVLVPTTMSISAEFSNARKRPFIVSITSAGVTVGSIVGALVAAVLLKHYGWQSVFLSGAVAGALVIPVVAVAIPESPAFLLSRRSANTLARVNRALLRLKQPELSELPPATVAARPSYRALLAPGMLGVTLVLCISMASLSTASYFFLNWLPQLIADAGFSPATGSRVLAAASVVGIVAAALMGVIANRHDPRRVTGILMVGYGAAIALFGFTPAVLALLVISACGCGFFLSGTTGVFSATMTASFPPLTRVTGIGFVMGIGRVASIAGPALAGWMFSSGLSRGEVSLVFAAGPALAGLLLLGFTARRPPAIHGRAATAS